MVPSRRAVTFHTSMNVLLATTTFSNIFHIFSWPMFWLQRKQCLEPVDLFRKRNANASMLVSLQTFFEIHNVCQLQTCFQWLLSPRVEIGLKSPLLPPLPFPFPSRWAHPLNPARGSGGALSSPSGSGRSPAAKQFVVHFELKSVLLVASLVSTIPSHCR